MICVSVPSPQGVRAITNKSPGGWRLFTIARTATRQAFKKQSCRMAELARFASVSLVAAVPEIAVAQELAPLENIVDFLVSFLTGPFARSVAIIAVAVLGYLGLTGRLRWGIAGSVIVGIALIFGAATIVDAVSGAI